MIRPSLLDPDFSIKFPHKSFPWRLEHNDKKTICYFECEEHLDKYVKRYKLKDKDIIVENKNGKSFWCRKTDKRSVEQKSGTKSKGSSGAIPKRKSSLDSTGNTSSNTRKKK
jgi:hypothetical protein